MRTAVADFVRALGGRYEVGEVLYQLTDSCSVVLGCDGAGVAVADEQERLRFVSATDEEIASLEERQMEEVGEGPCQEAFATSECVVSSDLGEEERWPAYRGAAVEAGARAVAGIPLLAADAVIGALNLYWVEPHQFDGEELEVGQLLADMAAAAIINLRELSEADQLNQRLQKTLDSRVVIEQARGMVAERLGIGAEEAFERLRAHASSQQRSLHEVAREVVEGGLEL